MLRREAGRRLTEHILAKGLNLVNDPARRASYGIYTPDELGDYLDAVSTADHEEYLRNPD